MAMLTAAALAGSAVFGHMASNGDEEAKLIGSRNLTWFAVRTGTVLTVVSMMKIVEQRCTTAPKSLVTADARPDFQLTL